jgi:hypothetical protein
MNCSVCQSDLYDCLSITYCSHKFHYKCIKKYLDIIYKAKRQRPYMVKCPVCRNDDVKKNNLKLYGYYIDTWGLLQKLRR